MGRAGRGERGRVAARVRRLLAGSEAPEQPAEHPGTGDAGEFGPLQWQPAEIAEPTEPGVERVARPHGLPRRWRLDPGRRAAVAVGVCALVAALVSGWWVLGARPHSLALAGSLPSGSPVGSATPVPSASRSASTCAHSTGPTAVTVVVDVSGKVQRPGVYALRAGARVVDAVTAAGGALPGVSLTGLNLAALLNDGQQVAVGVPAAPAGPVATGVPSAGATGSTGAASGPVNLNTAGLDELQTLPGIGPVTAQHILDWRVQHGQFTSVDQLREVSGIGDVKYAELKSLVSV